MKLSEKLIKLRKEKGLSQEEFGNEINVSRQAVSKWENEESKPDIDKIQEIVKKFNISYEYLLNDEIETMEEISKKECKKHKGKIVLKVLLAILVIYLLICVYKFIAFYRFYLVANSFSEENYWMDEEFRASNEFNGNFKVNFYTEKVGNKVIKKSYNMKWENEETKNMQVMDIYGIDYTDLEQKISYHLYRDNESDMYIYYDNASHTREDEIDSLFNLHTNDIRDNTLSNIPSDFKTIFLDAINPMYYYVSIINNEYRAIWPGQADLRIKLNNDCLIQSLDMRSKYEGNTSVNYNYDYVQDHFKEIEDPLETYKDKIIYEE